MRTDRLGRSDGVGGSTGLVRAIRIPVVEARARLGR